MAKFLKSFVFLMLVGGGFLAFEACGVRTSGAKLTIQAEAVGSLTSGEAVTTFTNRHDWTIELEKAYMLVGPVYLMEGVPQVKLWHFLRPWKVAYAHVNANGQRVLAELREHYVIDLLKSTPTSLGTLKGIEGLAETAELYLLPPGGTRLSSQSAPISYMNGATVHVEGKAVRGQETHTFQLDIVLSKRDKKHLVSNISTEIDLQESTSQQGHLRLRIFVDRWFTNVEFEDITNKDESGRLMLTAEDNSITQGVRSRHSYQLSWRSE